jgi:hypothetical protein
MDQKPSELIKKPSQFLRAETATEKSGFLIGITNGMEDKRRKGWNSGLMFRICALDVS